MGVYREQSANPEALPPVCRSLGLNLTLQLTTLYVGLTG